MVSKVFNLQKQFFCATLGQLEIKNSDFFLSYTQNSEFKVKSQNSEENSKKY